MTRGHCLSSQLILNGIGCSERTCGCLWPDACAVLLVCTSILLSSDTSAIPGRDRLCKAPATWAPKGVSVPYSLCSSIFTQRCMETVQPLHAPAPKHSHHMVSDRRRSLGGDHSSPAAVACLARKSLFKQKVVCMWPLVSSLWNRASRQACSFSLLHSSHQGTSL